jgi:hypothetical protein
MVKNWLVFAVGVQYLAAGVYDIIHGRWLLGSLWLCYSAASFVASLL